jgi:hypothetical protein
MRLRDYLFPDFLALWSSRLVATNSSDLPPRRMPSFNGFLHIVSQLPVDHPSNLECLCVELIAVACFA